jgi:uncharacterized membrane protein YfcA
MFLLFLVWGFISGYFSGFLGIGAGVLLMPFLTMMGIPYQTAIDASLMAVFFSSLTSSIHHHKSSGINWHICFIIMVPGVITALIGSIYLIQIIPPVLLQLFFAGLMFLNVDLLRISKDKKNHPSKDNSNDDVKKNLPTFILVGVLSGLMASLLGIGGGVLLVTLLIVMAKFNVKDAVKIAAAPA